MVMLNGFAIVFKNKNNKINALTIKRYIEIPYLDNESTKNIVLAFENSLTLNFSPIK